MKASPNHLRLLAKATALFSVLGLCVVAASCGASTAALSGGDGGSGFSVSSGSNASTGRGSSGGGSSSGGSSSSGSSSSGSSSSGSSSGAGGLASLQPASAMCLSLGAACASNGECCSGDCVGNTCHYPTCTGDGAACTANGACCSQTCSGGKCSSLNTSCATIGNACTTSDSCCSKYCASNGTCQASSFVTQPGDTCVVGATCATGVCNVAAGMTVGTCATSPPPGPANCGLPDGSLCSGAGTSGTMTVYDGGLPACGGGCCSRACAPWGPTGVLVCQPASGCHVVGDLCTSDGDCCGAAGLPGGSHKPVTCVIAAAATVGVCRNPMGCKPDGDVCKLKTMSCNSSCDCCAGNCEVQDTCHQDNVGVPRCSPASCVKSGQACASSADCCGGVPCVPNPTAGAAPPFICFSAQCVNACGTCTTTADCCPGSSCAIPAGGTRGICGPCGASPATSGASAGSASGSASGAVASGAATSGAASGSTSSGAATGTSSSGAPPPTGCSQYGQVCTTSANCCSGLPCTSGRCGVLYLPR